jgi:hypothetical protein
MPSDLCPQNPEAFDQSSAAATILLLVRYHATVEIRSEARLDPVRQSAAAVWLFECEAFQSGVNLEGNQTYRNKIRIVHILKEAALAFETQ